MDVRASFMFASSADNGYRVATQTTNPMRINLIWCPILWWTHHLRVPLVTPRDDKSVNVCRCMMQVCELCMPFEMIRPDFGGSSKGVVLVDVSLSIKLWEGSHFIALPYLQSVGFR
jgi:hypothetical protein